MRWGQLREDMKVEGQDINIWQDLEGALTDGRYKGCYSGFSLLICQMETPQASCEDELRGC